MREGSQAEARIGRAAIGLVAPYMLDQVAILDHATAAREQRHGEAELIERAETPRRPVAIDLATVQADDHLPGR